MDTGLDLPDAAERSGLVKREWAIIFEYDTEASQETDFPTHVDRFCAAIQAAGGTITLSEEHDLTGVKYAAQEADSGEQEAPPEGGEGDTEPTP